MLRTYTSFCNRSFFPGVGLLIIASQLLVGQLTAQDLSRRPLEHEDYDVWNTMSSYAISNDGVWATYRIQNGAIDGEATLFVQQIKSGSTYTIQRGADAKFTYDSRFLVYRITPDKAAVKKLKKDKTPDADLPRPQLQILNLESGESIKIENIKSFKLPEESGAWVACQLEDPRESTALEGKKPQAREIYEVTEEGLRRPTKKLELKSRSQLALERGQKEPARIEAPKQAASEQGESAAQPEAKEESSANGGKSSTDEDASKAKEKQAGTPLVLINIPSGIQRIYPSVASYAFSKNGKLLAFAVSVKSESNGESRDEQRSTQSDDLERQAFTTDGLHVVELESLEHQVVLQGPGEYKSLATQDDGSGVAFLSNRDDYEAETPAWTLYHWKSASKGSSNMLPLKDSKAWMTVGGSLPTQARGSLVTRAGSTSKPHPSQKMCSKNVSPKQRDGKRSGMRKPTKRKSTFGTGRIHNFNPNNYFKQKSNASGITARSTIYDREKSPN